MSDLAPLLPAHLRAQRWFASEDAAAGVAVVAREELAGGTVAWMLVQAATSRYQVLVASAPAEDPPEYLHGHDSAVLGTAGGRLWFDATLDHAAMLDLLRHITGGAESASRVRPMGVEQSNTSLVFDERLVLKLYRRLGEGPNPDVEVTTELAARGFAHVVAPVAVWRSEDMELGTVQPFLMGAAEGWALAQTSLRDLYGSETSDPAVQGGDFAPEARRLGTITAELHLTLADAFGVSDAPTGSWAAEMKAQLDLVGGGAPWVAGATEVFDLLATSAGGRATRVHGDLHLGQVVRTDSGWFVLDFEGEPARPASGRRALSSPLKDVAGMLRSLHYAADVALGEREDDGFAEMLARGEAWERHNREAFLAGYLAAEGVEALLPKPVDVALRAWELDKAVYELGYERSYRPTWERIPLEAIGRLLAG